MDNLDYKIKKALESNIDIAEEDKIEVWNNIENRLFNNKEEGEIKKMKSKKKGLVNFIAAAAAITIVFVVSKTQVGHAIVSQIKEFFAPEKEIVQEIEGDKEKTDVHLQQPAESNYIIYVDEERYEFIQGEESDKIIMKHQPDDIPEVSMEIKQLIDKSPEDIIKDIESQINKEYEIIRGPEKVTEPIDGWIIEGNKGEEWNSPVIRVYGISNGEEGSFIITQRYFLEASEGHGVRFDEMLKQFKILD